MPLLRFFCFSGIFLLGSLVVLDGVSTVLHGDSLVLAGALFCLLCTSACLEVDTQRKKVFYISFFSTSLDQSCQVECYPVLVQGSGEHGAVSSLPVNMGQASGRVDVPDGAKIDAAAAFAGTLRSRPGKLDALGSVWSREGKFNFSERL